LLTNFTEFADYGSIFCPTKRCLLTSHKSSKGSDTEALNSQSQHILFPK